MKDFLEKEVDEKYYIKSDKAERLIKDLSDRGLLPNGGGATIDLSINKPRQIDIANCIKARYDAGISNQKADGSGVVERASQ